MNNTDLQLGDVEVTALIPLMNRASEIQRKKPRTRDDKQWKLQTYLVLT